MLVGFIHGVLNTDNTAIASETIDYGPCAFMDAYHPDKVFSSIDQFRRYAFANQPAIVKWNLARFAETLLPLMADGGDKAIEAANASIARFNDLYHEAYLSGLRQKLGLALEMEDDLELGADLLVRMAENQADFTLTFRALCDAAADPKRDIDVRALFMNPAALNDRAGTGSSACHAKISPHWRSCQHAASQPDVHPAAITGLRRPLSTPKPDGSINFMSSWT